MTLDLSLPLSHADWNRASSGSGHAVQFYDDDTFLENSLVEFVAGALDSGAAAVVIATGTPLSRLTERLLVRGIDVPGAQSREQLVLVSAADMLSKFMLDGWPDRDRFVASVGDVTARAHARYARVRVFSEMAALLWEQRNPDAAIQLEALWNELSAGFPLLRCCAYPITGFYQRSSNRRFLEVCAVHSHVFPTESYLALHSPDPQLRALARGQLQKFGFRQREKELFDLHYRAKGQYWIGVDGRILWANQAELKLLGYTLAELIGQHVAELHIERERVDDMLQKLLNGESLFHYPTKRRCQDGSTQEAFIYSSALWKWEKFIYARCFTRDAFDGTEVVVPAV